MTIAVKIQQRGLQLEILADRLPSEILPNLVQQAIDYGYAEMMNRVPVRTGRLMGSIQKQVQGLQGSVGPTEPYAIYVECGTSPHEIRPVRAGVLRFEVGGHVIFTPIVHHPGNRPQPFVSATMEDMKERIPELFQELFAEAKAE